jgi:hypothetical protein
MHNCIHQIYVVKSTFYSILKIKVTLVLLNHLVNNLVDGNFVMWDQYFYFVCF